MTIALDLPTPLYVGNGVTVTATFTNPGSSDPVDPSTVTVQVKQGSSWSTYTYADSQVTKIDVGIYSIEILPTVAGMMTIVVTGTGTCAAVNTAYIPVQASPGP